MGVDERIDRLVQEYGAILGRANGQSDKGLRDMLAAKAEWTADAAECILKLARSYGSFMLSNALALALALHIEDGDLGF